MKALAFILAAHDLLSQKRMKEARMAALRSRHAQNIRSPAFRPTCSCFGFRQRHIPARASTAGLCLLLAASFILVTHDLLSQKRMKEAPHGCASLSPCSKHSESAGPLPRSFLMFWRSPKAYPCSCKHGRSMSFAHCFFHTFLKCYGEILSLCTNYVNF